MKISQVTYLMLSYNLKRSLYILITPLIGGGSVIHLFIGAHFYYFSTEETKSNLSYIVKSRLDLGIGMRLVSTSPQLQSNRKWTKYLNGHFMKWIFGYKKKT